LPETQRSLIGIGKKLITNHTLMTDDKKNSKLTGTITKKSGIMVLVSHEFNSQQKMLKISLHPIYNTTNAKKSKI